MNHTGERKRAGNFGRVIGAGIIYYDDFEQAFGMGATLSRQPGRYFSSLCAGIMRLIFTGVVL